MKVRYEKGVLLIAIILIIGSLVTAFSTIMADYTGETVDVLGSMDGWMTCGLGLYLAALLWTMYGRRIYLDEEGCILRLFGIEKRYAWNDFNHIQWYPYSSKRTAKHGYPGVILFSIRKAYISNPDRIMNYETRHPVTAFCIHFNDGAKKDRIAYGEVDKQEFANLIRRCELKIEGFEERR